MSSPADIRRVTFWQNMPSHHMAPVQRELAGMAGYQVRVIFASDISAYRKDMGWCMPELGKADCIVLGDKPVEARRLARESNGINLLCGFPLGLFRDVFENLPYTDVGTRVGLILEAGDTHDFKGKLRPIYHATRTFQIRKRTDFVFAFGSRGVAYYSRCGFNRRIVYPFLYQNDTINQSPSRLTAFPVRIVYVGALIRRKGVDLLFKALSEIDDLEWVLEVIGDGPQEVELRDLSERLGLYNRIRWYGSINSSEVLNRLQENDVCVVPSRNEGWGMLVSEALNAGLAVITTPRVGAKDLVTFSGAGYVTESLSISELTRCLKMLLASPEKIDEAKMAAMRIRPRLGGNQAAHYLDSVFKQQFGCKASQPSPPWKQPLDVVARAT